MGKHGAVHARDPEKICVEDAPRLLHREGFRKPQYTICSVVDQDIDTAGSLDGGSHSALDRAVAGNIEFEYAKLQRFALGECAEFSRGVGVSALNASHGRQDLVMLARERFCDEAPEAAARAGDQNNCTGARHGA